MHSEDNKGKISSRLSISLIVSFIIVVLAIIVIAAIFASFFGGLAYYLGIPMSEDQRRDQLIDDILGGTWRYSSMPLLIVLIIYSFLFLGSLVYRSK